jgi:hypothetical protein
MLAQLAGAARASRKMFFHPIAIALIEFTLHEIINQATG